MTTELATPPASAAVDPKAQQQQAQKKDNLITSSTSWHPSSKSDAATTASAATSDAAAPNSQAADSTESMINDPSVKFPLENSWAFWFYKNDAKMSWKENVKYITTVDFVEDFWGVYNHLQQVSRLNNGCDYMFFKKGIPPMWEDDTNKDGGRWLLTLEKGKYPKQAVDTYWLNTLLALIGDQFMEESNFVNGVCVNVRGKQDRIALWTRSAREGELQLKIGRRFKEIIGLKDVIIGFEEHQEQKTEISNLKV